MVTGKRKYPPAMKRYRKDHPTVSATMTKELREVLDLVRGGRSYNRAFQDIFKENLMPASEIKRALEAKWKKDCKKCNEENQRAMDRLVQELEEYKAERELE